MIRLEMSRTKLSDVDLSIAYKMMMMSSTCRENLIFCVVLKSLFGFLFFFFKKRKHKNLSLSFLERVNRIETFKDENSILPKEVILEMIEKLFKSHSISRKRKRTLERG